MQDYIDNYCERLQPGLWAEPVNALTNVAFFAAAYFAYRLARHENALNWCTILLMTLIAVIGTGSMLFHTFATFWSMLSDTLPILFYQIAFIALYARFVIGLQFWWTGLLPLAFFTALYGFGQLPGDWLNGSIGYAPAFLFLLGLSVWHFRNALRGRLTLLAAAGLFALSLTFRSVDMALCPAIPLGTHFLWHMLNSAVLYLTVRAYILSAEKS